MWVTGMTNIDIALLLSEWAWNELDRMCPVCEAGCSPDDVAVPHKHGCELDLALAERGFPTQAERNAARARIAAERARNERASAPTVIPPAPSEVP